MSSRILGPLFIALAASLWATDALFRLPTISKLNPASIVFFEHLIAFTVLLPWAFFNRKKITQLSFYEWIAAIVVGVGGSAIATILFTASFKYVNPSVSILLQKLQPVMTIIFAAIFLKEKPKKSFYLWAGVAMVSALVISFPNLDFSFITRGQLNFNSRGAVYALGAAVIWALSTVAGKAFLNKASPTVATFWRFWFGLVALGAILLMSDVEFDPTFLNDGSTFRSLVYMALIPGLAAVFFYYAGLVRTRATTATFVELIFPIAAVILNTIFLDSPLSNVQIAAGLVLLFAVTQISLKNR